MWMRGLGAEKQCMDGKRHTALDDKGVGMISVQGRNDMEYENKPLVSVMLCTYNGAEFIRDTIESVLSQSYGNLELIIVDDASTDNTVEVISEYASDERLKLIHLEKNQHICNAGNIAFECAKGLYGALIGHDDIWDINKLESQVQFLEANREYGVCFTWANIINGKGEDVSADYEELAQRFCSENRTQREWIWKLLNEGNFFCAPSAVIRMKLIQRTGGYRYGLVQLQDMDLWLRSLAVSPVYVMPEVLTEYRRFEDHTKNISGERDEVYGRSINETHYLTDRFISELPNDMFCEFFAEQLCEKNIRSDAQVLCEKALLRMRIGNGLANYRLMELLESDECRRLLQDIYGVSLPDFYRINTGEIFVSREIKEKMSKQQALIENYRELNRMLEIKLQESGDV